MLREIAATPHLRRLACIASTPIATAMKRITSRHNPLVAQYRATSRGETRDLMLLDGAHVVNEGLAAGVQLQSVVVAATATGQPEIAELLRRLGDRGVEATVAAQTVMDALSPVRSASRIVALAKRPHADTGRMYAGRRPLVVIAIDVQDPGNVGGIVRVAEAAGATGLVAAGQSADPLGWKALRGAMGSAFRLPLFRSDSAADAIGEARRHGCRIVATRPRGGRSLHDTDLTDAVAILIGGEGAGLAPTIVASADERMTIPMRPPVESLNAAATAAVILYEAARQRHGFALS